MNVKAFEQVATIAARSGGEVLKRRFREKTPLQIEAKGIHDYVTEVDREAEAAVLQEIRSNFPDHGIISEEDSPNAAREGLRWVVDPLDGTTNFIHGVQPFCVSVALEDDDGPLASAIYDPYHVEMFRAARGEGAFVNDEKIACSPISQADGALLATGFPFRELSRLDQYLKAFEAFVRSTSGIRRAGSAAIDLAYTACGRYDGFWEIGLSRWDIAAGILLVTEAGGRVSDPLGGTTALDTGDLVAAGPDLHAWMLETTKEAFGG